MIPNLIQKPSAFVKCASAHKLPRRSSLRLPFPLLMALMLGSPLFGCSKAQRTNPPLEAHVFSPKEHLKSSAEVQGGNVSSDALQEGTRAFHFDPKMVEQLTIHKSDPRSSDQWIAVFQNHQPLWKILSGPSDQDLLDRLAEDSFLNHLMDGVTQLRIHTNPRNGPPESFGLRPARFSLKWTVAGKEMTLLVGNPNLEPGGVTGYFVALSEFDPRNSNDPSFSSAGKQKDSTAKTKSSFTLTSALKNLWKGSDTKDKLTPPIYIGSGVTFPLLEQIHSFGYLRKKTWTTLDPDDIDEIELFKNKRSLLYAQREGDDWTDRRHQIVRRDMNKLLHEIVLHRLDSFVDDPQKSLVINQNAQKTTLF